MRFIFCGNVFSDIEEDMKKMKVPPPVSSHKYQLGMICGLKQNRVDLTVINIPRVRYFPNYPKIFFGRKPFSNDEIDGGINIGFVNILGLNYLTQYISLRRELLNATRDGDKTVLIAFNNYWPMNRAMVSARRKRENVLICNVLGDIHRGYGVRPKERYAGLKGRIIDIIESRQDELSAKSDAFGFLTKQMNEVMNPRNKPFVVIEGLYSKEVNRTICSETEVKTIFYAGAVEDEYGLLHLLRAFEMIEDPNYRLVIAGTGGAVRDVQACADKDKRIEYVGLITPSQVEEYQAEATCLVNPRTSDHSFVKYSFPSKNMECLASGKPYVAHDLECNPPEYRQYIQCPEDESDEALARELERVCSLPAQTRQIIGEAAQDFIAREKNPKSQCKKIVDMMESLAQEK